MIRGIGKTIFVATNGDVRLEGTDSELAKEFGCSINSLRRAASGGRRINGFDVRTQIPFPLLYDAVWDGCYTIKHERGTAAQLSRITGISAGYIRELALTKASTKSGWSFSVVPEEELKNLKFFPQRY